MLVVSYYSLTIFHIADFKSDIVYKSVRINLGKLIGKVSDQKSQIKFLQDTNVLPKTQTCHTCNKVLHKMSSIGTFVFFRCGNCKKRISIRKVKKNNKTQYWTKYWNQILNLILNPNIKPNIQPNMQLNIQPNIEHSNEHNIQLSWVAPG